MADKITKEQMIRELQRKPAPATDRSMFDCLGRMRFPDEIDERNADARDAWRRFNERRNRPRL